MAVCGHERPYRDFPRSGRLVSSQIPSNIFAYVGGNPLSLSDPQGLDATDYFNTTGGRSVWNGPTNGNWGGKCWSGGKYSCGGNPMGDAPPTDSADACYMRHDKCYVACRSDGVCRTVCDNTLIDELRLLPDDMTKWQQPPRPGTETDTRTYMDNRRWDRKR